MGIIEKITTWGKRVLEEEPVEMLQRGYVKFFQDKAGEWRFNILGNNHKVVAVSEGYSSKGNAFVGAKNVVYICRGRLTILRK